MLRQTVLTYLKKTQHVYIYIYCSLLYKYEYKFRKIDFFSLKKYWFLCFCFSFLQNISVFHNLLKLFLFTLCFERCHKGYYWVVRWIVSLHRRMYIRECPSHDYLLSLWKENETTYSKPPWRHWNRRRRTVPRINFDLMDKKNDLTCSLFDFSAKGFFIIDFYI